MRKVILSLGVSAALLFGIAATEAVQTKSDGFKIGGIEIANPFADTEVSATVSKFDISGKLAALDIPNPLANVQLPEALADVRFGNPFKPSTWWDGAEHVNHEGGVTMAFNFADPDFWMSIPNPKTHSQMHGALTNPANWAQFLKPETYAAMRDMNVLKKWFKAETYDVLLDPQTYAYWLQPGAYQHLINSDHYSQLLNSQAYSEVVDTGFSNFGMTFKIPEDALSLKGWMNSVSTTGSQEQDT